MKYWIIFYIFLESLCVYGASRGTDNQLEKADKILDTNIDLRKDLLPYELNSSHRHADTQYGLKPTEIYKENKLKLYTSATRNLDLMKNKNSENIRLFNQNNKVKRKIENVSLKQHKTDNCSINVADTGIRFFQNKLKTDPHFVTFFIYLNGNTSSRSMETAFKPFRWNWTPNTTAGPYPFLSWDIDYGTLSFGLLETRTVIIPFINLTVTGNCNLIFGTNDTSTRISKALGHMLYFSAHPGISIPYSYFCSLRVRDDLINTIHYYASLYLIYPIQYISYDCCSAIYNWENGTKDKMKYHCGIKNPVIHKWDQTTYFPYFVGLLILAYFPIYLCDVLAWMSKREHVNDGSENVINEYRSLEYEDDWVFENGDSPLTFCELLSFNAFGFENSHPILVSRFRRLICHLLIPSVIYFQLFLYRNGVVNNGADIITVKELVDIGAPMGFLSILGNAAKRSKVFVPFLGGPVGVFCLYFILGIVFVVFPRSFKQIIEDGLPSSRCDKEEENFVREPRGYGALIFYNDSLSERSQSASSYLNRKSPLFFLNEDILNASMVNVKPQQLSPGYTRGATLMRCSIYMLFTKRFWSDVVGIQSRRISCLIDNTSTCKKAFSFLMLPIYIIFCAFEAICCIIYYGIPFCFLVIVIVKGASRGLVNLKEQITFLYFILKYRIFTLMCVCIVFVLSSVHAYILALIFLKSFVFLSQIFVFCFISIIIYPSVCFGYIFFFTASMYFCLRQIGHFGEVYTDLLSTAVELSHNIEGHSNTVSFSNGRLSISNVRYEHLKDIRINGKLLDVSQNILRTVILHENLKIREKNNALGIPRKLFDHLIWKFRPVHQQVLSLVFKVAAMAALVTVTLCITSDYVQGPTTEISEVMHVIFIVAVGTLPELIEVTVYRRDDEHVEQEIQKRKIEQAIRDYWSNNNGIQN